MNTTTSIILMIFSSILAATGQLALKIGAMKLEKNIIKILKNHIFLIGVFFYGISALVTLIAFKGGELTVLYPIASLNYVWASILSIKYLKEKMNIYKWCGIISIIIGVAIIV